MKVKSTAFVLFVALLFSLRSFAMEGAEYGSMTGTVNTALSGNIPQASTDLFSGAFNTSYQISVPAGRRNIQPDIKLTYNSRGSDGAFGLGWSMPMASITRGIDEGIPGYDSTDKFYFSGQELVAVATNTYRLKIESSFMLFQRDTINNRWIVTDLNGTDYYFGSTPFIGIAAVRTGKNVSTFDGTFQWYLVYVEDIFTNYMRVAYTQPNGTVGAYLVSSMNYTGNRSYTLTPAEYYEVAFTYETRTDTTVSYLAGFAVDIKTRLSTITIKGNGSTISQYNLDYEYSPESHLSRLHTIQMVPASGSTIMPPRSFPLLRSGRHRARLDRQGQWLGYSRADHQLQGLQSGI